MAPNNQSAGITPDIRRAFLRSLFVFLVGAFVGAGCIYLATSGTHVSTNTDAITDAQNRALAAEARSNDLAGKLVIAESAVADARDDAFRATENARRSDAEARRMATIVGQLGIELENANRTIVEFRKQTENSGRIIDASLERFPVTDRSFEIIKSIYDDVEKTGQ